MHTIKPIDKLAVEKSLKKKLILTVEEHNIIGGLGSAVSEVLSNYTNKPKHIFLGIDDYYSKGGSYEFLKEKHGLDIKSIINNVKKNLNQ
jgi:transketolase